MLKWRNKMKSDIIFIIAVIVLAVLMYILLFWLIIDTFETRRYKQFYPVLFRIKPKISQSFKRESYVLIITLSIKDRRLRDISSQSRMRFYRRSI